SFTSGERHPESGYEHLIFIRDLAPDVIDYLLLETFQVNYPSVRGAKVNRAMTKMNGVYCSTRPMQITAAIPTKSITMYPATTYAMPQLQAVLLTLRQICVQFGELIYVKIPVGKGCGFVKNASRALAKEVVQCLHGTMIGQQVVRLSWGRSPASKHRNMLNIVAQLHDYDMMGVIESLQGPSFSRHVTLPSLVKAMIQEGHHPSEKKKKDATKVVANIILLRRVMHIMLNGIVMLHQ
ncbi:hypothetical protein ACJX0J_038858, partial [Zea mays]